MLREGIDGQRIPSGCAVSAIFSKTGQRRNGEDILRSIAMMHDRSNGLGGGFAAYGIYPEYREFYALHVFYEDKGAKERCEAFLDEHFDVVDQQKIPTRKTPAITDPPLIWRYFVEPLHTKLSESQLDEDTFTARCVIRVNAQIEGAYIFSSGKDMGIFKAVGYPEDVGEFYRLEGRTTRPTAGPPTAAIPPTPRAGGAGPTPLGFWTARWCTTGRSPLTTPTAGPLRCTATSAVC